MLHKIVHSLPSELERDALYFVRTNGGFDLYVTNHLGTVINAYPLNHPENLPIVKKTILSTDQETFFEINLDERKSFEWSVEIFDDNYYVRSSKITAVLNNNILENCEFAILGYLFNIDFNVIKDGNLCKLIIQNNELFDIQASVKLI